MKKFLLFFLILALNLGFIKPALAEARLVFVEAKPVLAEVVAPDLSNVYFLPSAPDTTAPVAATTVASAGIPLTDPAAPVQIEDKDAGLVLLNAETFQIKKGEIAAGKKFRAFNNQFVFQIDENTFDADAVLELKEYFLAPNSIMTTEPGFVFASRIFEFKLTTATPVEFKEPFWFSVRYLPDNYFRKTMFYFDDQNKTWAGLESIVSNTVSKLVSKTTMSYARVAIIEDLNIMSEGVASWYKYKGCNCAASPDYPKGTKLKVTNIDNGKSVIVKVNDWGPDRSIHPNRVIDLDIVAFKQIAKKAAGLCKVKVELAEPVTAALTK